MVNEMDIIGAVVLVISFIEIMFTFFFLIFAVEGDD